MRMRYVPAVGPRLAKVLAAVFALFALLGVNSAYLASITALEWWTGLGYQNYFYQCMFLLHLALGLAIVVPFAVFAIGHLRNAHDRPNRRAVRAGTALLTTSLVLLASGIVLTRLDFFTINDPTVRTAAYWAHVVTPLAAAWLFVLHRLAGPKIRWRVGVSWAAVAAVFAVAMVALHSHDPRQWNVSGPASGTKYFFPSLSRTATGNFIPARALMMDSYCQQCHADIHESWLHSAHRFSSFNNPAYLFSVRETRRVAFERDGDVHASRFCAGCHDPVPFFSGAFDDPEFDDVGHPTADAGITCTVCHAITHINTPRGNGDYTIEEPVHYPFAQSESPVLSWVNRQLVKANPELHKQTFLKPLHRSAEFCGTCHKVHLPEELNHYKFLRGQNHYDSYLLSGVSGHGSASFYYPPQAKPNCSVCHMPLMASNDFGARFHGDSRVLEVHDHMFPAANTGVARLVGMPEWVVKKHQSFLQDIVRVDLFGVREGGRIDGRLHAPLRPNVPVLEPGKRYLLEAVIRTLGVGHAFTQGTADSNEIWLDVTVTSGGRTIGRSGGLSPAGEVDPWSYFVNAYVLDRDGQRIDRRNAQDIFVALYDNQIPPGAAAVVGYRLDVPAEVTGPVSVEVKLRYRKFDATYMRYVFGPDYRNDLPITTLAEDRVTFPVAAVGTAVENETPEIPAWERWNDYGIGLLRKGASGSTKGLLRQAEEAFREVEKLGRPDGPLNRARVYVKEGRLDDAVTALRAAATFSPPAPPWSVAWLTGLVDKQNGFLDEAVESFTSLAETRFADARRRGFDFGFDYVMLNELGETLFERAKRARAPAARAERERWLQEAARRFERVLEIDPENVTAHYNLSLVYAVLGDDRKAAFHRAAHAKYKPDDNARDRVVAIHRASHPPADHAAEPAAIYDLRRPGAYQLDGEPAMPGRS